MTAAWHQRVREASPPAVLYHATTPRKLGRHETAGTILPPVRGFDTRAAAERWARGRGRAVLVEVVPDGDVWPLPDHHQPDGLAWWCVGVERWRVVR